MKIYHPDLDVTIERNPRQADILSAAGWVPADHDPPPEPDDPGTTVPDQDDPS